MRKESPFALDFSTEEYTTSFALSRNDSLRFSFPEVNQSRLSVSQQSQSRIVLGQKRCEMSYEDRCELLGWSTLEHRREYFSLVECYKIVFELNGLECCDYFEFCNNNTRSNNPFKICMKSAKVNAFKHSFFMRIIKE